MTFLNPWWLLLAAAAAIPVAIHFLRRRIGTRVELPTARYLARAEAEHSRELRVRNVALMLLRAGAIVLLAVAAARPFVSFGPGSPAPAALALVVDNSMSSGAVIEGRPALERLIEGGDAVLARARPQDRLWVVTADARILSGSPAELRQLLAGLQPSSGSGNLRRAIALAHAAVESSGVPGEIAILTDAQATQWDSSVSLPGANVAVLLPADPPPPNRAVVTATPEPIRWSGGRGILEIALLSQDSTLYRVTLADRQVQRGVAEPDARLRVPLTTELRGWIAGTVETERDELPADDTRHFALFAGEPPRASAAASAGTYAATAIATLVDAGRVAPGGDVMVAAADETARLPALLLPPADPIRIGAANRALERLGVPWRFGEPAADSAAVAADPALFGGAPAPAVTFRYRLERHGAETAQPADTLAAVRGEPWIVAGARYVLVGSPLDPAHTTLPVSAGFLTWLERTIAQRLAGDARGTVDAEPGDTLQLPAWADGVESARDADRPAVGRLVSFYTPGVRYLTAGGVRMGAVVVNPPRRESYLERLQESELQARLEGTRRSLVTADAHRFERALLAPRGRTDATIVALALAGLLLLAEMVFRSTSRTSRPPR